ncbi:NUDIX hydrolase [Cytobacillus purgationiresistens]|nr:NUDIX domain-containing protein [Cytobacillus purgationiresistens]
MLKVFNENKQQTGVASRSEVHKNGYWHETFHCWVVYFDMDISYIYFQLRSKEKADFPDLFDITAAGHLLANENVNDGIREVHEELGLGLFMHELKKLGEIPYCVEKDNGRFIDREFAHVYLYTKKVDYEDFSLQKEEVAGIIRAKFSDFTDLWLEKSEEIHVEGFEILADDSVKRLNEKVMKDRFVPHPNSYYHSIIQLINAAL